MMSGHCLRLIFAASIAVVALVQTPPAAAAGWERPLEGCEVITSYGAPCASGTHRGVDLAGSVGSEVRSPAGGRIAFAGAVPADGGGTCYAVTIDIGDGLKVSLLPLETVMVSEGDAVMPGDVVGGLSSTGDDSCARAHLHLGLRRSNTYLDPTGYLPAAASRAPEQGGHDGMANPGAPGGAGAGAEAGDVSGAASPAGLTSVHNATTPSVSGAGAAGVVPAPEPAPNVPATSVTATAVPAGRTTAVMDRLRESPLTPSNLQPVAMSMRKRTLAAPTHPVVRPFLSAVLALGMCGTAAALALSRKSASARAL